MPTNATGDGSRQRHLSPGRLGWRVALALLAIVLGFVSASAATTASIGRFAPEEMSGSWPPDGWIAADASNAVLVRSIVSNNNAVPTVFPARLREFAVRAIRHEPLAVVAVRDLGYSYQAEPGQVRTRKLMTLARDLSRRDAATNLWLMNDFARHGEEAAALGTYDVILRTSTQAPSLLLPAMAKLLQRREMVKPLAKLLARDPPWKNDFWAAVIEDHSALANAFLLRSQLHRVGLPMDLNHDSLLIGQLVDAGMMDEAATLRGLAAARSGEVRNAILANASFSEKPQLAPFNWKTIEADTYGAEIDARSGELQVSALAGAHGVLVQQLVVLANGDYRLSVVPADGDKGAPPLVVNLACANMQGRKSLDMTIPVSAGVVRAFSLSTRCRYVWFSLVLDGGQDQPPQDFRIDRISLVPVATARASRPGLAAG